MPTSKKAKKKSANLGSVNGEAKNKKRPLTAAERDVLLALDASYEAGIDRPVAENLICQAEIAAPCV